MQYRREPQVGSGMFYVFNNTKPKFKLMWALSYVYICTYLSFYPQIQSKGMQIVAELTMPQFSTLFIGSLFWKSEV